MPHFPQVFLLIIFCMKGINTTEANGLTLSDYFEELNAVSGMKISEVEFDSKYYDLDTLLDSPLTSNSFQYKVMHFNIRGLSSKFHDLKAMIIDLADRNVNLDFILLCETFLTNENADLFNIPGFHLFHKCRQGEQRGGVAIYAKESLKYQLRDDLSLFYEGQFESIFLEVMCGKTSTVVGEIYRIPNTNEDISIERYENVLSRLKPYAHNIIIGTDQNFDFLKLSDHRSTSSLSQVNIVLVTGQHRPCHRSTSSLSQVNIVLVRYFY